MLAGPTCPHHIGLKLGDEPQEINDLRAAVYAKMCWGRYVWPSPKDEPPTHRALDEVAATKMVEELVRTHMLAGHTADDLRNSEA